MGDFNTPLSSKDRPYRRKINKETQALNDTLDQTALIDIYRAFHPKGAEYTFFSSGHGTFSRTDHMLGHKASHSKFKKIEIISSIFSEHKHYEIRNQLQGASLVAQWLRICLPMQGTRVRALVWEDPTCHGATGPVSHHY